MLLNFLRSLFSFKSYKITSSGRTDRGRLRPHNEDSFALNPTQKLFFVADGMGGHLGGEVAAHMAIEVASKYLPANELNQAKNSKEECRHLLIRAFRKANHAVVTYGDKHPEVAGLGCTLIGCFIANQYAHFCHVGDVRGYLLRNNNFYQVTTDHSLAASTEPGSKKAPKNIITRCIGVTMRDDPEHHAFFLKQKDIILLCSDGLWNMVCDEDIKQTIQEATDLDACCKTLVNMANDAGGRDNITVALIEIME